MWCVLLLVSDDGGIDVIRSFLPPVLNDSDRVCMICISLSMVSVIFLCTVMVFFCSKIANASRDFN